MNTNTEKETNKQTSTCGNELFRVVTGKHIKLKLPLN